MPKEAKCHLWNIISPTWFNVAPNKWDEIYAQLENSGWYGEEGARFGFVSVIIAGPMVAGYFAHEGTREGVQYDKNKNPVQPENPYFFEHIFFILFLDYGQILLQDKRITDFVDLNYPTMRRQLFNLLGELFRNAGLVLGQSRAIRAELAERTFTQEEMLEFFRTYQITYLEVSGLQGKKVADNVGLFNPDVDKDEIAREALDKTFAVGLDRVKAEAQSEESPEANLSRGPVTKGLAAAGEIEKLTGRDNRGHLVYRERNQKAELTVELPLDQKTPPELLKTIFERMDSLGREDLALRISTDTTLPLLQGTDIQQNWQEQAEINQIRAKIATNLWLLETGEKNLARIHSENTQLMERLIKLAQDGMAAIRQLLKDALDDEELEELCFDYFHDAYEKFGSSQGKAAKIQTLIEYCYRFDRLSLLLEKLEQKNSAKYTQFVKQWVLQGQLMK